MFDSNIPMMFADRIDAGRRLAAKLKSFKDAQPVVLALPRGGVPVGFEIASALAAPLDVIIVRKIGAPFQHELALGAIVGNGAIEHVIDSALISELEVSKEYLGKEIEQEAAEIDRRRKLYYGKRQPADIRDKTAIVVDDGIATGYTMRAALRAIQRREPRRIVIAVPVAAPQTVEVLRKDVDEIVCLAMPEDLSAIGAYYSNFRQIDDKEVIDFLTRAAGRTAAAQRAST
jgi:putative phosphoribosyl transferase